MTKHIVSSAISQQRVARWIEQAKDVESHPTWTEKRLAIQYADHTYILGSGQVFVCSHCGTYDPEWTATEVIQFFNDVFGIKPTEIEVTVSVAKS